MPTFLERLQDPTPIFYDGALGTELFIRDIKLPNSTLANELYPEAVRDVHDAYISAGSDMIGTNTFVSSPLHLEMAGHDADDADKLVTSAVKIARAAADASDRDIYVAGSIGPSPGAIEADAGGTDFGIPNQKVRDAHERVAERMAETGIDLFCLETMFSVIEAIIAVDVVRRFNLPIAVNCTYKYTKDRATGEIIYKTDWGHSAASLLDLLSGSDYSDGVNLLDSVQVLGLNCGAEQHRAEHTGMPYACHGLSKRRRPEAGQESANVLRPERRRHGGGCPCITAGRRPDHRWLLRHWTGPYPRISRRCPRRLIIAVSGPASFGDSSPSSPAHGA